MSGCSRPSRPFAREVLDGTLRLMQALPAVSVPLVLVTSLANAVQVGDLAASGSVASHAGLFGLAKAFRNEHPELLAITLDLEEAVCRWGERSCTLKWWSWRSFWAEIEGGARCKAWFKHF